MKLCTIILVSAFAFARLSFAATVDYVREVKPILVEHCSRCHGASQQKGGLRLDTAASAMKGGEHGSALTPGKVSESLLIRIIEGKHEEIPRMPYKKPALSNAQIALLKRWITEGAKAPANEEPETAKHWAFIAPRRLAPPTVKQANWPRNTMDRFILARLETERIKPSPEADRVTLIRRVSLDLTGLPPTPQEVNEFVADHRPDAYERVGERLLASPHYAERWGRWWLDAARYADSNGYSIDAPRTIWKYRDWVIAALNRDLPFDQFITWQLAGDLIDTNTLAPRTSPLEPLIATGFHRNTQINQEGGIDPEQFRVESVVDRVNTTATALLGITLACAQCHDHKFDPFTQREYYQMFAFFNGTVEEGHGKGAPGGLLEIPGEFEGDENIMKELEEAEEDLDRYLNTQGSEQQKWEQSLSAEQVATLNPGVRTILKVPFAERTPKQRRTASAAFKPGDPEFKSRNSKLAKLERREPKPVTTLVMHELPAPRETRILIKGDFTRPGERVTPGTPAALHPPNAGQVSGWSQLSADAARNTSTTPARPSRLDLSRWIVATNNPLTARVAANRIWQQYFGRGLVETENDFGTQGIPPTHPELLDWLACELMEGGSGVSVLGSGDERNGPRPQMPDPKPWSLKHLHHLIVTSATYRQSSRTRPDLLDKDPNNTLLARQTRLRLDAEIVRDCALAASGLLSHKMGGPPVFPPQPNGVMTLGQVKRDWKTSTGEDRYRRGIYTHWWRATPHPALAVFDVPDAFSVCTRRLRSNTPMQALTLLNDVQFYEMAQGLAARILRESPTTDARRIEYAFQVCLARQPSDAERKRLSQLLAQQLAGVSGDEKAKRTEAWTAIARVVLNLDETITRE